MNLFSGSILGALMLMPLSVMAEVPEGVTIREIKYLGSGCPPFSTRLELRDDGESQSLAVILPEMLAEIGSGIPPINSRKNCSLSIGLDVPQGWQFALTDVDLKGFVYLQEGTRGEISLTQFFEGGASQRFPIIFDGPREQDFWIRDVFSLPSLVWSPCQLSRHLNLNLAVRVSKKDPTSSAEGFLLLGSEGEGQELKTRLAWRRCPS